MRRAVPPADTGGGAGRFARSALVGDWDQDRLAGATAVVAGIGALGNEVVKNLALAGLGRLVLCDPDTVDVTNLSRTALFTEADVGRPKVDAAAAAAARLSPGTSIIGRRAPLTAGVGLGELADADIVFGCLDTLHARMRLLGRCALVGAALVDGGTSPWGGEVRLRLANDEACYACALSPHQRAASDLPWSCADPFDEGAGAAPATIAGTALVASWMTLAGLRVLLGAPPGYRVLAVDGPGGRTAPVRVARDPRCPHHRPLTGAVLPLGVAAHDTVGALLSELPAGTDPLAWTEFPVSVSCLRCGGYDRSRAVSGEGASASAAVFACPRCGDLVRPRLGLRIREAEAGRRLGELGVAPEEILPVRLAEGGYRWHRLAR